MIIKLNPSCAELGPAQPQLVMYTLGGTDSLSIYFRGGTDNLYNLEGEQTIAYTLEGGRTT